MNRAIQRNVLEFRKNDEVIEHNEADSEAKRWRNAELAAEAISTGMAKKEYAREVGKSPVHIRRLVRIWEQRGTDGSPRPRFTTLYAVLQNDPPEARSERSVRQALRDAPLEQVEQIIADLPKERKQAVRAAAGPGNDYAQARHDYNEDEKQLTPAERKEREAAGDRMTRKVVAWSDAARLTSSLEIAHELMRELNASGEVTAELAREVTRLLAAIEEEHRVMRAMAGLSIDLDEVEAS